MHSCFVSPLNFQTCAFVREILRYQSSLVGIYISLSPFVFVCLFVLFWGVPLIDITCVFICILIFLSSRAFTVSFGICQHLPSGENSLQVAECVCVQKLIVKKKLTRVVITALRSGWSGRILRQFVVCDVRMPLPSPPALTQFRWEVTND